MSTRQIENNVQLTGRELVTSFLLTVGNTATIVPPTSHQRTAIEVFNESGVEVRIGGSGVTMAGATRGRPIADGTGYAMNSEAGCDVYLISAAGGADVTILEIA